MNLSKPCVRLHRSILLLRAIEIFGKLYDSEKAIGKL